MGDDVKDIRILKAFISTALLLTVAAGTMDGPASEKNPAAINEAQEKVLFSKLDKPIVSAMNYLLSCQNEDGGFGANPESKSNIKDTALFTIASASIGEDPSAIAKNEKSPLDYLVENQEELNNSSNVEAQVGRYVVALASAGLDPRDINGIDYVQILKSYCRPGGEVGKENYIWDDAWVIMALAACDESQSNEATGAHDHLKSLQTAKGCWAWNGGANGEDPDTTSVILCALISGGEENSSDAMKNVLEYLQSEQNQDGGFSSLESNAATDAWAIMAINAAGQNPKSWRAGQSDRSNPIDHLLSLQRDDGSIWWKKESEGFSFEWTANGVIALTGGRMPPENLSYSA
jgi:squalene cyclase